MGKTANKSRRDGVPITHNKRPAIGKESRPMRHGVDPGPTFKFIVHLIVMRENSNRLPALCPRGCTSCPGCSSCGTDFTDARTRSTCALNFGAAPAFGADFTDLAFLGNAARGGGFSPSGAFLAALILTCFSGQTMPAPKVRDRHSSLRGLGACRPQPSVAAPQRSRQPWKKE